MSIDHDVCSNKISGNVYMAVVVFMVSRLHAVVDQVGKPDHCLVAYTQVL